jgi:hypothetical protein
MPYTAALRVLNSAMQIDVEVDVLKTESANAEDGAIKTNKTTNRIVVSSFAITPADTNDQALYIRQGLPGVKPDVPVSPLVCRVIKRGTQARRLQRGA